VSSVKFLFFCLKIAFIIFAFIKVAKFCEEKSDKFRLGRIFSSLDYNPLWMTRPLVEQEKRELDAIFNQKFTYFASGGQCYAFLSADGKSVIKFFKHHRRTLPQWILALPLPAALAEKRQVRLEKKRAKLKRDFASYKLSFENLAEETGVLFIHLNKTATLKKRIKIIDKLHIEHEVPLDQVEFVVQRRAELVYPHLSRLIQRGDLEGAKSAVRSLVSLIVKRSCKGIYDEDARIHRNFGFIDGRPLIIDVGRLVFDPSQKDPHVYQRDVRRITERFKNWLQKKNPQLSSVLEEEIESLL